jgi:CDGSH-type Zn-finger protein
MSKQCTCGHSSAYPICDGSHKAIESAMDVRIPLNFKLDRDKDD